MSFHGAEWLERPERVEEERPELLLLRARAQAGQTVAAHRAGTGYYSWRMAQRVGASGTVYAVDIQAERSGSSSSRLSRRRAANVKAVLAD